MKRVKKKGKKELNIGFFSLLSVLLLLLERAKSKVNLPNPSELWILTRMNRRSRHDFKKAEDIGKKKRESWRVIEIDALFGFFCRGKLRCSEIVVRE